MRVWELMFDIEIGEVYSVNQETPEHGETPGKKSQRMASEDVHEL
jgi:hypothetical protein